MKGLRLRRGLTVCCLGLEGRPVVYGSYIGSHPQLVSCTDLLGEDVPVVTVVQTLEMNVYWTWHS